MNRILKRGIAVALGVVLGIGFLYVSVGVPALRPPTNWPVYSIELDVPANTTTELVGAQTKRIRVVGMWGIAGAQGTITFKSAATEISGDVPVAKYNGAVLTPLHPQIIREYGWMDTAHGEALNITTSVDTTFDGVLLYAIER